MRHAKKESARPWHRRGLGPPLPNLALPILKKETYHLSTGIRPRGSVRSSGTATGPCVTEVMNDPLFHHLVAAFVGVHGAGVASASRRPPVADRNPRICRRPGLRNNLITVH